MCRAVSCIKVERSSMRALKRLVMKWFYRLCLVLFPVNKKVLVFESNAGRNYTGNPRFIYEEMVRQGLDKEYRIYYVFDHPEYVRIPGRARKIKRMRFLYYYAFAVAGTWVCDLRLPNELVKRKGCTYIQTWHGTPLKKLALDMTQVHIEGEEDLETYQENFRKNAKTWDYLISQNPFSTKVFRRAFDYHKKILEIGYPRNDVLFVKNKKRAAEKIKKRLGIPVDKKLMLYAPTWRDDEYYREGEYKFSSPLDYQKLKENFGGEYCMIAKYHYLVKDPIDWSEYQGFLYPCDMSYDISYLYLAADLLITDYSSVMFDYSILDRPMFFFAYDLKKYEGVLRGFYFDFLKEAPGPVVETTDDLIAAIKDYDRKEYEERIEAFHKKFNPADDGKAAKKVVQLICKKTKKR